MMSKPSACGGLVSTYKSLFDGITLSPTHKKTFDSIAEGIQNQIKLPQVH
jgi:hypothetical protein